MKLIIDIPDYNLNEVQNGSIAGSVIIKAVKNGIPYNPSGDAISREGLKSELNRLGWTKENGFKNRYVLDDIIDNASSVPLPDFKAGYKQAIIDGKANYSRPKGEWKYAEYPNLNKEVYYCSNCDIAFPIEYVLAESINPTIKELTVFEKDSRYNFCPCCGADMRGKEE